MNQQNGRSFLFSTKWNGRSPFSNVSFFEFEGKKIKRRKRELKKIKRQNHIHVSFTTLGQKN